MLKPVSNSHSHAKFHESKEPWIHISSYPERITESHDVEWNVFLGFYTGLVGPVGLGICHVWCKCCRTAPASSDDCGEVLWNWLFLLNWLTLQCCQKWQPSKSEHNRIIQGYPLARASAAWAIGHIGEGWQKNSCNTVPLLYCTQNCWFLSAAPHVLLRFICKCWPFVVNGYDRSGSCPEMLQWPRKMPGRSWLGLKLRCVVNGQHVTVHSVLNPFVSLHTTIKSLCVKSCKLSYFWTRVFCFFAAWSLHF